MAAQIKHSKVSLVPDVPADAEAGKVLASDWNADHVVEGFAAMVISPTEPESPTEGLIWIVK